jgi:uncharacterized protein involved in response to NO
MNKFFKAVSAIVKALFCDKDVNGRQTTIPSFAKMAFWILIAYFLNRPGIFTQWWFYVIASLLAYILFGTKFIPAFFANRVSESENG